MASENPDTGSKFTISEEEARRRLIAEITYFATERRGFSPGYELDDWLQAEQEVETSLEAAGTPRVPRSAAQS